MTDRALRFAAALLTSAVFLSLAALPPRPASSKTQEMIKPAATGYAESAEGLRVYYEVYGQGEPIVVMAGGLMDISTMAQTIGPLSRSRQVIGIDLEGHGRTALRKTADEPRTQRRRRRRRSEASQHRKG